MDITEKKFFLLLDIYDAFQKPNLPRGFLGFNSQMALSKRVSGCLNPPAFIRGVVAELLEEHVLVINVHEKIWLDEEKFDKLIEESKLGKMMLRYVNDSSELFVR